MAKASDNVFPKVLIAEGSAPTSPASGNQGLFIDSTDHKLKRVNSSGTVTIIESAGGGSAGRVLLSTKSLAVDTATISFTSSDIPTTGYAHLELVLTGRTTQVVTSSPVYASFNGDTTDANYYRQLEGINGSTAYVNAGAGRELLYIAGASATAGQAGSSHALITEYAGTTFWKVTNGLVTNAVFSAHVGSTWKNTAAITSIDLTNPANFKAGTICRLYGLV